MFYFIYSILLVSFFLHRILDKSMQLNQAKFRQNGGCGYVLRPEYMFSDDFDPNSKASLVGIEPVMLTIKVNINIKRLTTTHS